MNFIPSNFSDSLYILGELAAYAREDNSDTTGFVWTKKTIKLLRFNL